MTNAATVRGNGFFAKKAPSSATLLVGEITNALKGTGLAAGQLPDPLHQEVKNVGIEAIQRGKTVYCPPAGLEALRIGASVAYEEEFGVVYDWLSQIGVRGGGKGGLSSLFETVLTQSPTPANPDYDGRNKVIIPDDQWLSYVPMVANQGHIITVPSPASQGYKMSAGDLRTAIAEHDPKIILWADPGNPTGASHTRPEIEAQNEVLADNPQLIAVSEIMYRKIMFEGKKYEHHLKVDPTLADRFILNDCFSKYSFGHMPGPRVGIVAGPSDIIKAMNGNASHSQGNANSIGQWMGVGVLFGEKIALQAMDLDGDTSAVEKLLRSNQALDEYHRLDEHYLTMAPILEGRRDMVVEKLSNAGFDVPIPDGSFYVYPDMSRFIGMKVPEGLELFGGADPAILDSINQKFGTNLKPMGGQTIKNSTDMSNLLLLHAGAGVVDGAEFNPIKASDRPSTAFRMAIVLPDEKLKAVTDRIVTVTNNLRPSIG
ncbi:MAG: aminotransferase class I/II-fold pyridoxal phosphate-dependent enzyme [Alphaproteobacteria bacterium]